MTDEVDIGEELEEALQREAKLKEDQKCIAEIHAKAYKRVKEIRDTFMIMQPKSGLVIELNAVLKILGAEDD